MERNLQTVLTYFGHFSYAPRFTEILTFFPQKISKKNLHILLRKEAENKKILRLPNNKQFSPSLCPTNYQLLTTNCTQYTLPQYSIAVHNKRAFSPLDVHPALRQLKWYIQVLTWIRGVRFVGITGASALEGLRSNDDLDLCIVTAPRMLWTSRACVVIVAKLLAIHGKKGVCLNLFFDESDLVISKQKQNSYIAHELLQMKPIIDKNEIYKRFLSENKWIYGFFPNAQPRNTKHVSCIIKTRRRSMLHVTCYMLHALIDHLFKSLQLPLIYRNKTGFFISTTQLWLFKSDFEKKLRRMRLVV